jgi:hypothetical protein
MVNCCATNCQKCYLNTQILLNDKDCQGVFVFTPDPLTSPGPCGLTGPNTSICPMNVNILENCKGDYKITLLDDNGCALDTLVLRCGQYEIVDISTATMDLPSLEALYDVDNFAKIIQINANNLNLVGEYVAMEETAYFYRRVTQTYLNLWCGAESKGLICQILDNAHAAVEQLDASSNDTSAQFVYALANSLLKTRVVALKQLCECGKVCNDQFFPTHTNPCQALRGCCPRY